ncbi:MAG: hypothetical protein LBE80_06050, partial [Deltaproteobacteria bacterium]|nr:hypothetical protein [Deltaproteobacteria bacterium]
MPKKMALFSANGQGANNKREIKEARISRPKWPRPFKSPPQEIGAVKRDRGGRLAVALVWPGDYHTGMSSLGYLWVYRFLAQSQAALGERFFALDPGHQAKAPLSLESRRRLSDFDLIAASMVLENDYWLLP